MISPSLQTAGNAVPLLRSVEARALAGLGRHAEARAAADAAIAGATSESQRGRLAEELADLLPERDV